MDSPRVILHLDLDAFFCAVEEIKDPGLRGKAFAVGGSPGGRGVVTSCSYPARKMGVRSAMPSGQALLHCPHLIFVSRNHHDYGKYSKMVMERLGRLTDQVEQISIDEAFIDITDLGAPRSVGLQLQRAILEELKLPNSIGIASNKLLPVWEKLEPAEIVLPMPSRWYRQGKSAVSWHLYPWICYGGLGQKPGDGWKR